MKSDSRSLTGLRLGISISESQIDVPYRVDSRFVNELTVRFASTWLNAGGRVALGHRWHTGGIMQQVAHWAQQSQWIDWDAAEETADGGPAQILNLLAWPDVPPSWDATEREEMAGIFESRMILPPGIAVDGLDQRSDLGKVARIRALSAMRRDLAGVCDARVCIGGASGNPERRLPGVLEEALFTYQAGKPLYISAALGGASKAMADAILQRRLNDEARELFFTPSRMVPLIERYAAVQHLPSIESASTANGWNALSEFQSIPIARLAAQSGLLEDEVLNLLTTPEPQRVMGWVIAGMGRLHGSRGA